MAPDTTKTSHPTIADKKDNPEEEKEVIPLDQDDIALLKKYVRVIVLLLFSDEEHGGDLWGGAHHVHACVRACESRIVELNASILNSPIQ